VSRAVVIIRNLADRACVSIWARNAPIGTRVEFKEGKRTLDQNSLMWARLTEIARQVEWYGQKLSADDWKDVFSASLRKARVVPGLDPGSFVPLGMRTSDMGKEEMGNLLDLMDAFAAERGVVFHEALEA
jgi:NinB protein